MNSDESSRKSLATRRTSATIPPLMIQNSTWRDTVEGDSGGEDGGPPTPSPPGTPTSFSGLIKGKWNSMSIPEVFKKKKPREYKIQVFVALLFLTIIILVGTIYVIHKERELHKAYFEQIHFHPKDRKIRVVNSRDKEVLFGILGTPLTDKDKAWPCLEADQRVNSTCMEWMNKGRLYFSKTSLRKEVPTASVKCYQILWERLSDKFVLKDCYYMTEQHGYHWYGGGEMRHGPWPLNRTYVPFSPLVTGNKNENVFDSSRGVQLGSGAMGAMGDNNTNPNDKGTFQFGRTLSRSFLNSLGGSIRASEETPLHVSMNEGGNGMLCIGADPSGFLSSSERVVVLNYTICAGDNVKEMNFHMMDKNIWEGIEHKDLQLAMELSETPIWRILPEFVNSSSDVNVVLKHTESITEMQFSKGFVLLDEWWQKNIGDLSMDNNKFPGMAEALNITRRRGFKVALTVSPFVSTESENYVRGLAEGVWLWETGREFHVPAHTRYKNWNSVTVLDSTSAKAQEWFLEKLQSVVTDFGVHGLWLDVGTSRDFPQFYLPPANLTSSDGLAKYFVDSIRRLKSVNTFGVSGAIHLPKPPTFVSMSPTESSWAGLQSVIPNMLSLGVGGNPFIIPGAIGGDFFPIDNFLVNVNSTHSNSSGASNINATFSSDSMNNTVVAPPPSLSPSHEMVIPDRNLYIRWMQLAHFLPVVHYSFLPKDYDDKVVQIALQLRDTRAKISKFFKKVLEESIRKGLPIIRPLWTLDPTDPNCLKISDEFMIGSDVLVAPILKPGATRRDVYLPKGKWRNELDGSNTKGEKTLHSMHIREDQIAYFTRDNSGPLA